MKKFYRSRTRLVLVLSSIVLAAVVCCYAAVAKARRAEFQGTRAAVLSSKAQIAEGNSRHGKNLERENESIARYGESVSMSPSDYLRALATARELPPSSLLKRQRLDSPETSATWTYPLLMPIDNGYKDPPTNP